VIVAVRRAGIVVTGTEMVNGQVPDSNGPWLARRLAELGVQVSHVLTVGDRPAELLAALEFLRAQGVHLIVISGGLGPTEDDITAEVVAGFAGTELVLDEAVQAQIAEILARYAHLSGPLSGFDRDALAAANRKQAMVPRGAVTVRPAGTAPGWVLPVPAGPTVIVLPGPPRELRQMWSAALSTAPATALLAGVEPLHAVRLRLYGLPESEITETLRGMRQRLDLSALEITTCLRRSELEIDIRHRPGAEAVRDALVEEIAARHGRQLFSTDGSSLDEQVAALLRGRWIGLAESCTGGLLTGRLTERAGASEYVAGGVVAYSDEAKTALLGVPASLIERHGAVSPEVALAMAEGARDRFGADVGCGVTGVAGPGGGTAAKPVGYVCVCVTTTPAADGVLARDLVLPGDRAEVRDRSVTLAMHLIRRLLS
jgi:nicotinamide-nucleotide amidase